MSGKFKFWSAVGSVIALIVVFWFLIGYRSHLRNDKKQEVEKNQKEMDERIDQKIAELRASANVQPVVVVHEKPKPRVQSVRFWVPPCAVKGKPETWSPAVKPAGKCRQLPSGNYTGEYEDPTLVNYTSFPQKVSCRWDQEDDTVELVAVVNGDYNNPYQPIPGHIRDRHTFNFTAEPPVDGSDETAVVWNQKFSTIRFGTFGKKGTWVTVYWIEVVQ
jgi:hypothetical protein